VWGQDTPVHVYGCGSEREGLAVLECDGVAALACDGVRTRPRLCTCTGECLYDSSRACNIGVAALACNAAADAVALLDAVWGQDTPVHVYG
jgi:hypothetical protein